MDNVYTLLFSSPWFWIVLVLVILVIAFRAQLARFIDRTQKAKIEAGKDGAKVELEVGPSGAAEKSPADAPLPAAMPGQSVEVGHGAVISGSTFGDIGNVIIKSSKAEPPPASARPTFQLEATTGWNTAVIRELLAAAFSDEELATLCFDYFRPVYQELSTGMSTSQKIQRLLDYCERHDQFGELLALVRERNPVQYRRFEGRLRG